jgi:hypothetical protein
VKIIRAIWEFIRRLLGINARHNRVLDEVKDWTKTVARFLAKYGLDESDGTDKLLEESGDVKFELTEIVYKGRPLVSRADKLRDKAVLLMVAEIIEYAESLRRYLISPALQRERLDQAAIDLRSSLETLKKTLAGIEYL